MERKLKPIEIVFKPFIANIVQYFPLSSDSKNKYFIKIVIMPDRAF